MHSDAKKRRCALLFAASDFQLYSAPKNNYRDEIFTNNGMIPNHIEKT